MKQLILASESARRKKILKDRGIKFKISPSNIDEETFEHLEPVKMVETLSLLKAKKAASKNPNSIILGADTTVVVNNEILSKPKSKADAYQMLKNLSGKTHKVITGFAIIDSSKEKTIVSHTVTYVTFRKITDSEINKYLEKADFMDKAGAYAIQEEGGVFVEQVKGDYLNVVGLPSKVFEYLKEFGVK